LRFATIVAGSISSTTRSISRAPPWARAKRRQSRPRSLLAGEPRAGVGEIWGAQGLPCQGCGEGQAFGCSHCRLEGLWIQAAASGLQRPVPVSRDERAPVCEGSRPRGLVPAVWQSLRGWQGADRACRPACPRAADAGR
jgi:hypothetical protein